MRCTFLVGAVPKAGSLLLLRITGREIIFMVGLIPCTNFTSRMLLSACSVYYTLGNRFFAHVERQDSVKKNQSVLTSEKRHGDGSWRLMPEATGGEVESSSSCCKSDDWLFQNSQRTCSYCGCVETLYLAGLGDVRSDRQLATRLPRQVDDTHNREHGLMPRLI